MRPALTLAGNKGVLFVTQARLIEHTLDNSEAIRSHIGGGLDWKRILPSTLERPLVQAH